MEAKDKEKLLRLTNAKYPGMNPEIDIDWDVAEISFKAGWEKGWREGINYSNERFKHKDVFKAGEKECIKEVVDWVKSYLIKQQGIPIGYLLLGGELESKLKEWGIKEGQ